MGSKMILVVLAVVISASARVNAKEKTLPATPQISDATAAERATLLEDDSSLQDMFLLPEVGTGLDPANNLNDCGAFTIHGVVGEAGWYYHGQGHRAVLVWAGSDNGNVKYNAWDGDGNHWVFIISDGMLFENKEHVVWIDADPSDAMPPVFYQWGIEAK